MINVSHGDPLILAHLQRQSGRGQRKQRLDDQALEVGLREAALDENARQFDLSLDQQAYAQAQRAAQYQDALAQKAYRDRSYLAQRQAERDAAQYQDQVDFLQQAALQGAQQDFYDRRQEDAQAAALEALQLRAEQDAADRQSDWTADRSEDAGKQANLVLKDYRSQRDKFTPEGLKEFNRLATGLRAIQGAANLDPEQRNQMLGQWFDNLNRTELDQYIQEPPSVDQELRQSLAPLQGQAFDRNDPTAPLPPGKYMLRTISRSGTPQMKEITVPGSSAATQIDPKEYGGEYQRAYQRLITQRSMEERRDKPTRGEVHAEMRESLEGKADFFSEHDISAGGFSFTPASPGSLGRNFNMPLPDGRATMEAGFAFAPPAPGSDALSGTPGVELDPSLLQGSEPQADPVIINGLGTQDNPYVFSLAATPEKIAMRIQEAELGTVFVNPDDGSLWVK